MPGIESKFEVLTLTPYCFAKPLMTFGFMYSVQLKISRSPSIFGLTTAWATGCGALCGPTPQPAPSSAPAARPGAAAEEVAPAHAVRSHLPPRVSNAAASVPSSARETIRDQPARARQLHRGVVDQHAQADAVDRRDQPLHDGRRSRPRGTRRRRCPPRPPPRSTRRSARRAARRPRAAPAVALPGPTARARAATRGRPCPGTGATGRSSSRASARRSSPRRRRTSCGRRRAARTSARAPRSSSASRVAKW